MLIQLDLNSDIPLYQQLHDQIIVGIADGRLREGESLPSVRQLGADIGINLHTVNKVYTLLRQEGFLTVHRQKGVVINAPENYRESSDYRNHVAAILLPIVAEARCRGVPLEDFLGLVTGIYDGLGNNRPMRSPRSHDTGLKGREHP